LDDLCRCGYRIVCGFGHPYGTITSFTGVVGCTNFEAAFRTGLTIVTATPAPDITMGRPSSSFRGSSCFIPLYRKILNLPESQDLRFAFSDDRRAHALLNWQYHRPCQRNELFRVKTHFTHLLLGPAR
jgi:hypothetical protein